MVQITTEQSRGLLDLVSKKPSVNIFIGDCIDVLNISPTEELIQEYEDFIAKEEEKRKIELAKEQEKREALEKQRRLKEEEEAKNLEKIHRLASKKMDINGNVANDEQKPPEKILPKVINDQDDEKTKTLKERWNKYAVSS